MARDRSPQAASPIKLNTTAGDHIGRVIAKAVETSNARSRQVAFDFNGVHVLVSPGDDHAAVLSRWEAETERLSREYRESPKGRAARAERDAEIVAKQGRIELALAKLPSVLGDEATLMAWIGEFAEDADDVGVKFDMAALADLLTQQGYSRNDCVDIAPGTLSGSRRLMARYIVGQVIDCLASGMPPHPITAKFVADYQAIPAPISGGAPDDDDTDPYPAEAKPPVQGEPGEPPDMLLDLLDMKRWTHHSYPTTQAIFLKAADEIRRLREVSSNFIRKASEGDVEIRRLRLEVAGLRGACKVARAGLDHVGLIDPDYNLVERCIKQIDAALGDGG